jgi:hypothetical protein
LGIYKENYFNLHEVIYDNKKIEWAKHNNFLLRFELGIYKENYFNLHEVIYDNKKIE